MKKILTLLFFAAALSACGSDDNDTENNPADTHKWHFTGDVSVSPLEGSPFNAFEDPGIVFDLALSKADDGSFTLTMNKIKFVEQMPKRINFDVRDLQLIPGGDGTASFSAAETVPYWNGVPYDPAGDGTYTIHNLAGSVTYASDGKPSLLGLAFDCYSMHVSYTGAFTGYGE